MGGFVVKLKTHFQSDISGEVENCLLCKLHNKRPVFLKTIAGKRKETFFHTFCDSDDCSIVGSSLNEVLKKWNQLNS